MWRLGLLVALANVAVDPCANQGVHANFGAPTPGHARERILVTGGSGFIGSHTVELLLQLGYNVRVLDNLVTGYAMYLPLQHPHLELHFGSASDKSAVKKAMVDVDGVIHLAAMSKVLPSLKDPAAGTHSIQTNVDTTAIVLELAATHKVHKVVYAASSTFYGNGQLPFHEENKHDQTSPYASSKYMGELIMDLYNNLYDVRTLSLRFFMVFGPRQPQTGGYAVVTGKFLERLAKGEALVIEGDGLQNRDFVHVHDVARAVVLGYQAKARGMVINVGSGKQVTINQLADAVSMNQTRVPARPNDLRATLADTCRAKQHLHFEAKKEILPEIKQMVEDLKNGKTDTPVPDFWTWPETVRFLTGTLEGWKSWSFEEKNAKIRAACERNPLFLSEAVRLIRRSRHEEL